MKLVKVMRCETALGEVIPNIGTVILQNALDFGASPALGENRNGRYEYWNWQELKTDVIRMAAYYRSRGLSSGSKIGFVSANGYWRLVCELACMSSGMVSVPVFNGYPEQVVSELLNFAGVNILVTDIAKFSSLGKSAVCNEVLFIAPPGGFTIPETRHVVSAETLEKEFRSLQTQALAMIMFTSGTSGMPKGVQLTHHNILSQQKALELLWRPEKCMRFLCYLPWHHSFGGLFERFFALCTGGCLAIDDSCGKNIDRLLDNYRQIKPNVYFSVPKVYQEIIARVLAAKEFENTFFHPELKFIFTAAAPLALSTSDVFKAKGVPVAEGWGLTETSPCCTLTKLTLDRTPGVVGLPIPGVEVALDDSGEILVRGPNVMLGYYERPDATRDVFNREGWFHTGDLGEVTDQGLRILSRKDRMFKLNNGEKVFPAEIEERVKARCKFIKHAFVYGRGQSRISMLVFPNVELFGVNKSVGLDNSCCKYPCSSAHLNECLNGCLKDINAMVQAGFERVGRVVIVPRELSIENSELTPSFKLVPRVIEERYRDYMAELLPSDAFAFQVG